MLVEAWLAAYWSAVARPGGGDMALMLKNPAKLPVTMLWYSNGGRSYAPWNGRHRTCSRRGRWLWSLHGHAA